MRMLGIVLMATGLLNTAALGATATQNAPKSNAMQTKAPSDNPLDAVMDDVYRRETSGQITPGQAQDIYGAAVTKYMAIDPEIVKQHFRNIEDRPD